MIRLVIVLTKGGVTVRFRGVTNSPNEFVLGALVEAVQSLGDMVGSGDVQHLKFRDDTMILTKSKKGYSVVALVDKSEDYMDSLIRLIADAIDDSQIPPADGTVAELHMDIVDRVLSEYIKEDIDVSFLDLVSEVWPPLLRALEDVPEMKAQLDEVRNAFSRADVGCGTGPVVAGPHVKDRTALEHALDGDFECAWEAARDQPGVESRVLAVKMGCVLHSMTLCCAPPIPEIRLVAQALPDDHPLTELARALVGTLTGETIRADYARAYRSAISRFRFVDDGSLAEGLIFLDPLIVEYPAFAEEMVRAYRGRSTMVVSYITAMQDRRRIFDRLYSATSYDEFRSELIAYRRQISAVMEQLDKLLGMQPTTSGEEHKILRLGPTLALTLQNYVMLLTGVAESPVLSLRERIDVLREVRAIYRKQIRPLLLSRCPLFAPTVDSIFQSVSVVLAESHTLAKLASRTRSIDEIVEFIQDLMSVMKREAPKRGVRISFNVVANALLPVLAQSRKMPECAVQLLMAMMMTLDVQTVDAIQFTRPDDFATDLANTVSALASAVSYYMQGDLRTTLLKKCVFAGVEAHRWFVAHGTVCRDDIMALTSGAAAIAPELSDSELDTLTERVCTLNRVAMGVPIKYRDDATMMALPLVSLLRTAWLKLGHVKYRQAAQETLRNAISTLQEAGLDDHARRLEQLFPPT